MVSTEKKSFHNCVEFYNCISSLKKYFLMLKVSPLRAKKKRTYNLTHNESRQNYQLSEKFECEWLCEWF